MAKKTIEHRADKGRCLTIDEVGAWVQEAMRSGADGSTVVKATVSMGQKLQRLSVEIDTPTQAIGQTR